MKIFVPVAGFAISSRDAADLIDCLSIGFIARIYSYDETLLDIELWLPRFSRVYLAKLYDRQ